MAAVVTNSTFRAEWMFAAWDIAGFDPRSQAKQIAKLMYSALEELEDPPTGFMSLSDDTVAKRPGVYTFVLFFVSLLFAVAWETALLAQPPSFYVFSFLVAFKRRVRQLYVWQLSFIYAKFPDDLNEMCEDFLLEPASEHA